MRIAGFLNGVSGAVHFWDDTRITAERLGRCITEISKAYPDAQRIYLVMDNWFVHAHEQVARAVRQDPRMQILFLPTYAPWLNPIEKLWRLMRQNVCHCHQFAGDFETFKLSVRSFLQRPTDEPGRLLTYVGLSS